MTNLWKAFMETERSDRIVDVREFLEEEGQYDISRLFNGHQDVVPFEGYKFDAIFNTSARPQNSDYAQRLTRHNFLQISGAEIADILEKTVPHLVHFDDDNQDIGERARKIANATTSRYLTCFDACRPLPVMK